MCMYLILQELHWFSILMTVYILCYFLTGNKATSKVTEERDAAQGQVEFLNSVIVDLQKKNTELKTRLEIMESGVVTNGDGDSSMESE